MIQAIGLTRDRSGRRPPSVVDLSFDARSGQVTALLGPTGAGKSTALRLMLGLERGRGRTLFDGRPYHRIRRPEREIGVLIPPLGVQPGHPGRRARAHLRMLAAAAGVPARRADQLLEQTRLVGAADQRLRDFSPGMRRRLALAAALLGDPHTLVLDAPTAGLSPKNVEWLHAFLGAFAANGGTVLLTSRDAHEVARVADHVVSLDHGVLIADQSAEEFARTRLRDEVVVRGPQVGRLAEALAEAGAEVRQESGTAVSVSGLGRTEIGELAYRHGVLLHELADRVVEHVPALPRRAAVPWSAAARRARPAPQPVAAPTAAATAPTTPVYDGRGAGRQAPATSGPTAFDEEATVDAASAASVAATAVAVATPRGVQGASTGSGRSADGAWASGRDGEPTAELVPVREREYAGEDAEPSPGPPRDPAESAASAPSAEFATSAASARSAPAASEAGPVPGPVVRRESDREPDTVRHGATALRGDARRPAIPEVESRGPASPATAPSGDRAGRSAAAHRATAAEPEDRGSASGRGIPDFLDALDSPDTVRLSPGRGRVPASAQGTATRGPDGPDGAAQTAATDADPDSDDAEETVIVLSQDRAVSAVSAVVRRDAPSDSPAPRIRATPKAPAEPAIPNPTSTPTPPRAQAPAPPAPHAASPAAPGPESAAAAAGAVPPADRPTE